MDTLTASRSGIAMGEFSRRTAFSFLPLPARSGFGAVRHEVKSSATPLKVVVAYDELAAGTRALKSLNESLPMHGDPVELQLALWRLYAIEDTDDRQDALADVLACDLLIISSCQPALTSPAERWMEATLALTKGSSPAIALFFNGSDSWFISLERENESASIAGHEACSRLAEVLAPAA